jgi:hypothetical protein
VFENAKGALILKNPAHQFEITDFRIPTGLNEAAPSRCKAGERIKVINDETQMPFTGSFTFTDPRLGL